MEEHLSFLAGCLFGGIAIGLYLSYLIKDSPHSQPIIASLICAGLALLFFSIAIYTNTKKHNK